MANRNTGPETTKYLEIIRGEDGFATAHYSALLYAERCLDIGPSGSDNFLPITGDATGVDLGYPGYDGVTLPFPDKSQQYVYSSHALEHIRDQVTVIREWFRVIEDGGYLFITVPHQFLYERKSCLPSNWNLDHKRMYTPALLLAAVEQALKPNTYRVIKCRDLAQGYDYDIGLDQHPGGNYSIELVIQKIKEPVWEII